MSYVRSRKPHCESRVERTFLVVLRSLKTRIARLPPKWYRARILRLGKRDVA